jgi:hypothetical protein
MAIYQWIRKRMGANLDNRSWHHIKFNVFNEKKIPLVVFISQVILDIPCFSTWRAEVVVYDILGFVVLPEF